MAKNINTGAVLEALNNKIDLDAENINQDGKNKITSFPFPSPKTVNLTWGASGFRVTAPSDGWICVEKAANAAGQFLQMNATCIYEEHSVASTDGMKAFLPVRANESVQFYYNYGGATNVFRFIYGQGNRQ